MPVDIDLAPVDAGAGDPAAVFGKDAADLVDVNFSPPGPAPDLVDLYSGRKGFLGHYNRVKVGFDSRTVPVIQRFYGPGHVVPYCSDSSFELCLTYCKRPDGMHFPACECIGGKANHHLACRPCKLERAAQQLPVTVMQGIEGSPYHNLHAL